MKSHILILTVLLLLMSACTSTVSTPTVEAPISEQTETDLSSVDLAPMKDYAIENGNQMQTHTTALEGQAEEYYEILSAAKFDYQAAWETKGERLAELMAGLRESWIQAHIYYELEEGIIAGVPSLADYDTWIDAGPPASEAPEEAYTWTLELPNGESHDSPGNLFHTLLEPALYGTNPDFVGAEVDLDGNGEIEFTEALPEANLLYGSAQALNSTTAQMNQAVADWNPTVDDAFTALVVMTPTMSEYFEQWKLSSAVAGEATEEQAFIAASRLVDVSGILQSLDVTYASISGLVVAKNPELDAQIQAGYADLGTYVDDLYEQEQAGTQFTAEEADLLGTEAQAKAQALSALVAQAAEEIGIKLDLE
jgi:hypothetical protein